MENWNKIHFSKEFCQSNIYKRLNAHIANLYNDHHSVMNATKRLLKDGPLIKSCKRNIYKSFKKPHSDSDGRFLFLKNSESSTQRLNRTMLMKAYKNQLKEFALEQNYKKRNKLLKTFHNTIYNKELRKELNKSAMYFIKPKNEYSYSKGREISLNQYKYNSSITKDFGFQSYKNNIRNLTKFRKENKEL